MSQPMRMDPEVLLAVAAEVDVMAAEFEAASSFDPATFQGPLAVGFGPAGAPFAAAYTAAAVNHVANAKETVLWLRAFAQGLRDSVAHYEGTDAQNAAILAQLDQLPDEMKDQIPQELKDQIGAARTVEAGFKEKFPFKESPDPPGMPAPPPDPPVPGDVAAYNSETRPWDKAAAAANKAEARILVQGYFHAKGFELSNSMIDRYLENTGEPVALPDSVMSTIVSDPQVKPKLDEQVGKAVQQAVAGARDDPSLYGTPQAVVRPWETVIAQDNDITNADAHFSVGTTALVTVNPPDENGQITYSAEHQTHMYDYYYFHQTEQAQWDVEQAAKQAVDDDMRMLESEGWAKSFKVHGSSQVTTTTGTYNG